MIIGSYMKMEGCIYIQRCYLYDIDLYVCVNDLNEDSEVVNIAV